MSVEKERARHVGDAERGVASAVAKLERAEADVAAAKDALANAKAVLEAAENAEYVWVEPTESVQAKA